MNEEEMFRVQLETQERLARQSSDDQQKVYAPQLHEHLQQAQAVVIQEINPNKVVKDVLRELEGKEIDENGEVIRVSTPYLNDEGLKMAKFFLRGVINQSNTLSHLEDHEIQRIMEALQNDLVEDLGINWKKYGINNRTTCDLINNILLINSLTVLKRAREQNEKNFLRGITIESISGGQQQKTKKDSFLSKFKL